MIRHLTIAALATTSLLWTPPLTAAQAAAPQGQPAAAPQTPPEGRRGGGRGTGLVGAQPLNMDDRAGFESIFDGTLKNWDGDPSLWRAENGMLVGETTAATALKENSFIIWRGGEPADFELKLELRMNATNSGIQVRSQHLPPGTTQGNRTVSGKWVLKGYQADIDYGNQYSGMFYEERGREFLMRRGQAVHIGPDGSKKVVGQLERSADELKALIKPGDWNYVHIIARGNMLVNIVNGHVMAMIVDDDEKGRAMKGLIGLQIHTGPPMKIEFRNIYLKKL